MRPRLRASLALLPLALGALLPAAATLVPGCGTTSPSALDEPIHVQNGVFKEGTLPGSPPLDDSDPDDAGVEPPGPHVTLIESLNNLVQPGQSGKSLGGRATGDSRSVGIRFADLGTGYWLVPMTTTDPMEPSELDWSIRYEIARDVPPGLHELRLAAIDEQGRSGAQRRLKVCVTSEVPDNLNACDRRIAPPAAVLSLRWDSDVDLDLGVVTPDGKLVDPKHPSTAPLTDGGVVSDPKNDGAIDRDSNAACAIDGQRRESLVWQSKPAPGTYLVYANLFSACGQQAVRFTASLWLPEPTDGGEQLVDALDVSGELLAADANGGASKGLYLTSFTIQ